MYFFTKDNSLHFCTERGFSDESCSPSACNAVLHCTPKSHAVPVFYVRLRDSLLSNFKVCDLLQLSSFFYVTRFSVSSVSGKQTRVVSLNRKFRVNRIFEYPRFPRSTLPRIIRTLKLSE